MIKETKDGIVVQLKISPNASKNSVCKDEVNFEKLEKLNITRVKISEKTFKPSMYHRANLHRLCRGSGMPSVYIPAP